MKKKIENYTTTKYMSAQVSMQSGSIVMKIARAYRAAEAKSSQCLLKRPKIMD